MINWESTWSGQIYKCWLGLLGVAYFQKHISVIYAPINVMPHYHRYGLSVGDGRG